MGMQAQLIQAEILNSSGNSIGSTPVVIETTRGGIVTPTQIFQRPTTGEIIPYSKAPITGINSQSNSTNPRITQTINVKSIVTGAEAEISNSVGSVRSPQLNGPPFGVYLDVALDRYKYARNRERQMETNPGTGLGFQSDRELSKIRQQQNRQKVIDYISEPFRKNPFDRIPKFKFPSDYFPVFRNPKSPRIRNPNLPFPKIRIPYKPWELEKPADDSPESIPQFEIGGGLSQPSDTQIKNELRNYLDCTVIITFAKYYTPSNAWDAVPGGSTEYLDYNPTYPNRAPSQSYKSIKFFINTITGSPIIAATSPQQLQLDGKVYSYFATAWRDDDFEQSIRGISFQALGSEVLDRYDDLRGVSLGGPYAGSEFPVSNGLLFFSYLVIECNSSPPALPPARPPKLYYRRKEEDMPCLALQLVPILERIESYLAMQVDGYLPDICGDGTPNPDLKVTGKGLHGISSLIQGTAVQNSLIGYHLCTESRELEIVELIVVARLDGFVDLPPKTVAVRVTCYGANTAARYRRFDRANPDPEINVRADLGFVTFEAEEEHRLVESKLEWEKTIFPVPKDGKYLKFYYWLDNTAALIEAIKEKVT